MSSPICPVRGTGVQDRSLVARGAQLVADREHSIAAINAEPDDTTARERIGRLERAIADLDEQLARQGMNGRREPDLLKQRARSTRRRQDVPDLPRSKGTGPRARRVGKYLRLVPEDGRPVGGRRRRRDG